VADIETIWEEYWLRLMGELDGVKTDAVQKGSGSAMEIVLRRGSDLICQGGGGSSMHDEQNAKVLCAPTRAGGETYDFSLFYAVYLVDSVDLMLISVRVYSGGSEDIFHRRLHSGWTTEPAYSSSVTDSWCRSDRGRDSVHVLP
jgi:hypothetical protein